ncbi:MAG TPA: hypothetical protein VFY24_11960 [Azospira sp.]|nr:hypothetical protein [Azospira sp.]
MHEQNRMARQPDVAGKPDFDTRVRRVRAAAVAVATVAEFKRWIRQEVRDVLPHGAFACGYGRPGGGGMVMDYVLTVDYPLEHLAAIRNATGEIETPLMRRCFQTESPVLFDADRPWPDMPEDWLAHFRRHQLLNAAAHAGHDEVRRIGTYFSFHRLPPPLGQLQRAILIGLTPLLHETLLRVVDRLPPVDRGLAAVIDITRSIDAGRPAGALAGIGCDEDAGAAVAHRAGAGIRIL